jgi:hypothetical protein
MAEMVDLEVVDASNTDRFPEGMLGGAINNAARALEGLLARWYFDTDGSITSTGSANAYAVTSNRTIAALVNNTVVAFTANFANTGAATLALNGLTAKSIKRPNGDALAANDIVSGQQVVVVYKSSPDEWRLLSPGAFQAGDAIVGGLALATQTLMEAAASLVTAVTPGRQHFHPGHPKAVGRGASAGGIVGTSYNVASITRNSTGNYTVTLTNAMADTNYGVVVSPEFNSVSAIANWAVVSSSSFTITLERDNGDNLDRYFSFAVYGDMA